MTPEKIIEWAREATKEAPREDWNSTAWVFGEEALERFAQLVAEHEREQCAKVCDYEIDEWCAESGQYAARNCAEAIRNRGMK